MSQLDSAVARQGNLNDRLATTQDQLILAQNIEIAQVVTPAVAAKTTARSRRTSITIGALGGLIVGLIAAIVTDSRRRPQIWPVHSRPDHGLGLTCRR